MFQRPDRSLRWDVLELHLEEAGYLWAQWEAALADAGYTLAEVAAGPEWRLLAHLDALVVAGRRAAEKLLRPALEADEPEKRTAAAFALLSDGEGHDPEAVLGALAAADDAGLVPLARALQLTSWPGVVPRLEALAASGSPGLAAAALGALAFRAAPSAPALASRRLGDGDGRLLAAALRALWRAPTLLGPDAVRAALAHPEASVRAEGLLAGLVAGQAQAWRACRALAERGGEEARLGIHLLGMGGPPEVELLSRLLADAATRRDALFALGLCGQRAAAEACLAWLGDDEVGGVAAEAFCAITGLAPGRAMLREAPGEEEELPPLEEDLARSLLPGPDEDLPLLGPEPVEAWWAEHRDALPAAGRLLRGQPFDLGPLCRELADGPARRRPALAVELAVRSRGTAVVEPRAFTAAQREQLSAARSLRGGSAYTRPLGDLLGG